MSEILSNTLFKFDRQDAEILLSEYSASLNGLLAANAEVFEKYFSLERKIKSLTNFLHSDSKDSSLSLPFIQETINNNPQVKDEPNGDSYPYKGSWNEKIRFYLKGSDLMNGYTAKELCDFIASVEGAKPDSEQMEKIRTGVYATLSMGIKSNKYKREKIEGMKEYTYQLAQ